MGKHEWNVYGWSLFPGLVGAVWLSHLSPEDLDFHRPKIAPHNATVETLDEELSRWEALERVPHLIKKYQREDLWVHRWLGLFYLELRARLTYALGTNVLTDAADERSGSALPQGIVVKLKIKTLIVPCQKLVAVVNENRDLLLLCARNQATRPEAIVMRDQKGQQMERLELEHRRLAELHKPATLNDHELVAREVAEYAQNDNRSFYPFTLELGRTITELSETS